MLRESRPNRQWSCLAAAMKKAEYWEKLFFWSKRRQGNYMSDWSTANNQRWDWRVHLFCHSPSAEGTAGNEREARGSQRSGLTVLCDASAAWCRMKVDTASPRHL